ncbi:transcription factor PAR1-like [Andrographis paniculata]|uniref:transcription factor PAR1-like n=1 Tax=Andrographis paniculata TaxID=175694 RepID=UPI0021E9682D|nr:transcription factor PAR1-like [Andrographis paniculata]
MENAEVSAQSEPSSTTEIEGICNEDRNNTARIKRKRRKTSSAACECDGGVGEGLAEEKFDVKRRIVALQKIVPGSEGLPMDKLFEETAEYIASLKRRVQVLRFLCAIADGEQRKSGG